MRNEFTEVLATVDLLLFERKALRAMGVHFRILHRFRATGSDCAPGEEVTAAYLVHRAKEFRLPLGCSLLLLFDYLSRQRMPLTAAQIISGMRADPFFQKHGANAPYSARKRRQLSHSSIKEYMKRLRAALGQTFCDARLHLDPLSVLVSEETLSNQAGYRLRASCEWIHIDIP
jgi:hypothetical protein